MTKPDELAELEEWRLVEDYPDFEVSNHGRVRRIRGWQGSHLMNTWPSFNKMGYPLVRLSMGSKRKVESVHRLVAKAFIPNPLNKPSVNHIDCNPANNNKTNLEWCTQKENIQHSKNLGRYPDNYWKGKRSPYASLTDEQAKRIKELRFKSPKKLSYQQIANIVGTNKKTVMNICNGRTYLPPTPETQPKDSV